MPTGPIFLILGLAALAYAVILWIREQHLQTRAVRVLGQVVRVETAKTDDGDPLYAPVVQFESESGTLHRVDSKVWSSDPIHDGQPFPVLYPPGQPENARLDTKAASLLPVIVSGGAGLVLAVFGVILWITG